MTWLWWLISIVGVGGVVAAGALLAPVLTVKIATGVLEAALTALSWFASALARGITYIAAKWYAVLTLIFFVLMAGYIGDRYDPVRNEIPQWAQRAPPQRAQKARPKQKTVQRQPQHKAAPEPRWSPFL